MQFNKMGSSRSEKLNILTKVVWWSCNTKNLWLAVARITAFENHEAYHESRHINLDIN